MMDQILLEEYEAYLAKHKGLSQSSLSCYLRDIRQLSQYLRLRCPDRRVENAKPGDLDDYLAELRKQGKTVATVSRAAAAIRGFYGYLEEQYSVENPSCGLKTEHAEPKTPQILTNQEVQSLLRQPECVDPKGYRDRAMLELLYSAALRIGELVSLDVGDVDLAASVLRCRGKEESRTVPLPGPTVRLLREYIQFIRPRMVEDMEQQALFVNLGGSRMSRQGFWKLFKGYYRQSGITKEVTPHMLRQSFAAHRLQSGTDVRSLQKLLGQAYIGATQSYTQLVPPPATRTRRRRASV